VRVFGARVKIKVKVKFTLEQAVKTQRGSRGIEPLFRCPGEDFNRACPE
jgi:hypothetical protein